MRCHLTINKIASALTVLILLAAGSIAALSHAESTQQPAISIIIDDVGNEYRAGMRAIRLPGPLTYAVLPQSPFGQQLATAAYQRGKEIILHMPMDNHHNVPLGPGGLSVDLDYSEFTHKLESAIAWVPHISGLNNHMGSRLTQNNRQMQWLMNSVKRYPLYFVDSRTSVETVAELVAIENKIPTLRRDVFLDHDASPAAIHQQFIRLLKLAEERGTAVAIGHPYQSTLGYLEIVLPQLDKLGVRLVTPSALLEIREERDNNNYNEATTRVANATLKTTATLNQKPSTRKEPSMRERPPMLQCKQRVELEVTRVSCS